MHCPWAVALTLTGYKGRERRGQLPLWSALVALPFGLHFLPLALFAATGEAMAKKLTV